MTNLGPTFGPDFTGYPAGMSPEDYRIWSRWWPMHRHQTQHLWFNVGLGEGSPLPPNTAPDLAKMWTHNTQVRADAILETLDDVWLVELRFNATANAIGRLLLYRDLLNDDNPFGKPITAWLVTDRLNREVENLAQRHQITYRVA